jgi:transaldolase
MQLFLDSSNPREILEARSWGLLSGVTTNPTLISVAGSDMEKTLAGIVDATPGVVLVQAIGWHDPEPLIRQARWLHAFSDKIVVKLPASIAGLQALQQLKRELPDLRLAVTAIASLAQAYLAGKAGAYIAAIFNGPLDQAEDTAHDMIAPVRKIYTNYGFQTKILACGRYPRLFGEVAVAGADICTMRMEFMRLLYQHPFTDQRMNGFLKDWRALFGEKTWPEKEQVDK